MSDPNPDESLRRLLDRDGVRTSARHDENVLAAARAMASAQREPGRGVDPSSSALRAARARRWVIPLALAASFVAGILVTRATLEPPLTSSEAAVPPALVIPLDTLRGSSGRTIPVEQAKPDDWYRYIQELLAAGETREAERHLRRFNELHPNYAYQP